MDYPLLLVLLIISPSTTICYLSFDERTKYLQRLICVAAGDTATIIVYDESYDYTTSVLNLMVNCSHTSLLYEYQHFYTFLGRHVESVLKSASLTQYRSHLDFMLICGTACSKNVLNHATFIDNTVGLRSLLRHFSTWLIITDDPPPHQNITLDNVAFMRLSALYPRKEAYTSHTTLKNFQTGLKQNLWNVQTVTLYTLLWMPRGREWSRVHPCDHRDDKTLYSTMFPNTQRGLNGRQLLLATLEWRPYAARQVKDGEVYYVGAGVDAMDMLGKQFNFSYAIVEPEDMLWGRELENGSWNGVTGMIQRGEADTCPVPFGMGLGRKKVMDFTSPVLANKCLAFYRRRTDDTKSWLYYLSSFSWQVNLCGAASLLWTLCLLVYMRKKSDIMFGPGTKEKKEIMLNCVDTGIRISLRQGILTQPETTSVRFVIGTLGALCLVITAVFTGNLVAFATVDKYKPPFSTLQELVQQDEYAIGAFEGGYAENVLMTTDDPLLKAIYKKIVQSGSTISYTSSDGNIVLDSIQRVLDEKYVLISTLVVKNAIKSMTCDVEELKEKLIPFHSSFIFPRHSPLMKLFDKQVLILRESGMMGKLTQDWTPNPKMCEPSMEGKPFELDSLKTALVTCSAGILVSVVVLLMEMAKKK